MEDLSFLMRVKQLRIRNPYMRRRKHGASANMEESFVSFKKLINHTYSPSKSLPPATNQYKQPKYLSEKKGDLIHAKMLPRDLEIACGDDQRYWHWNETDGSPDEVAELKHICWLDVNGMIPSSSLSPNTTYEVVYIIKLRAKGSGWEVPVSLVIRLQGIDYKHNLSLMTKPREKWIELQVGEFLTSSDDMGYVRFFLCECEIGNTKSGLLIKGVVIRPKTIGLDFSLKE